MTEREEELRRQRRALRDELASDSEINRGERLQSRPGSEPDLERVMDIPVRLTLEVGGANMAIRDLLQLHQGGVVELDRHAGEPLDVLVNGKLIARGEVVVVDEKLGIRLTEVLSPAERLQSLRS